MIFTKYNFYTHYLLLAGVFFWVFSPNPANAFFWNEETAPAQQFQASELVLVPIPAPVLVTITATNTPATFTLDVQTTAASVPAQHDVLVEAVVGDVWCSTLTVGATSPDGSAYSAPAPVFASGPEVTEGNWQVSIVSTDEAVPVGANCTLSLRVEAWQVGMAKGGGYSDSTLVEVVVIRAEPLTALLFAPLMLHTITETESAGIEGESDGFEVVVEPEGEPKPVVQNESSENTDPADSTDDAELSGETGEDEPVAESATQTFGDGDANEDTTDGEVPELVNEPVKTEGAVEKSIVVSPETKPEEPVEEEPLPVVVKEPDVPTEDESYDE